MTTRKVSHEEAEAARVTVGHGLIETGHRIAAWDTLGDYIEQQREREALAAADDAVLEAADRWLDDNGYVATASLADAGMQRRKLRAKRGAR